MVDETAAHARCGKRTVYSAVQQGKLRAAKLGGRVQDIKKTFESVVLKAHDHEPIWTSSALSSATRAQLRTFDLHFNGLRHEAGRRWPETGVPIHVVQQWLGHTNLAQTSPTCTPTAWVRRSG